MKKKLVAVGGVLLLALSGCAVTSPVGPDSNHSSDPTSASRMAAHLRATISQITSTTTLTSSTDPAHELGRAGEYTKAVVLHDSRVSCTALTDACGAEILIWPTLNAANKYSLATSHIKAGSPATLTLSPALSTTAVSAYRKAWTSYFTPDGN